MLKKTGYIPAARSTGEPHSNILQVDFSKFKDLNLTETASRRFGAQAEELTMHAAVVAVVDVINRQLLAAPQEEPCRIVLNYKTCDYKVCCLAQIYSFKDTKSWMDKILDALIAARYITRRISRVPLTVEINRHGSEPNL